MTGPAPGTLIPLAARLLKVRRSEVDRTLRFAGLAAVLGWGMYTAFNATQAIFLTRAGVSSYPVFFILLALTVWPAVAVQGRVTRRIGVGRAFRYNLLLNVAVPIPVLAAYLLFEGDPAVGRPVVFAAYIVYSVAFELVMLHFWSFVSQHFNLLEGKRIYPVIAAGSSAGYILAGLTTTVVVSTTGSPEPLLLVWMLGAGLAWVITYRAEPRLFRPPVEDEADLLLAETVESSRRGRTRSVRDSIAYLSRSPLVLAMAVLALFLVFALRVSDYLVAVVFVRSTHSLAELTVLIGNAWLVSYVVQMVLALFVTPWLLAKAGVKNAILMLPVAALVGFAAVALSPILASAFFLFVVRNGLQTGIDDPAANVLSSALPDQISPRLKLLLDDLVLPGSAVLAGVFLLGSERLLPGTSLVRVLALVGIPLSALFLLAALRVRSLYVSAIYERLRSHAISLGDLQQALGRPSGAQVEELRGYVGDLDPKVRGFAAAALGKLAPDVFGSMVAALSVSVDANLRRLAYQMAPPGRLTAELLEQSSIDPDSWVVAAGAVAGFHSSPPWPRSSQLLGRLARSKDPDARAAAVWAASSVIDERLVVAGLRDREARVRLEAIRSFAKLKGHVERAADPLIHCLKDANLEVRREALHQAIRWAPPPSEAVDFGQALLNGLTNGDRSTRRLAAEAIAVQNPATLERAADLLGSGTETAAAAIEALVRSGRPELGKRAQEHMERVAELALEAAAFSARLRALARLGTAEDARFALLRLALQDYTAHSVELGLACMRAMHGKRGFATVERGLRRASVGARAEAAETLLNFGPGWLAVPLVRLLDPEAFEGGPIRPLSAEEVARLGGHPDTWVQQATRALGRGLGERMKDLVLLKKVPMFSTLTLEQLSSIDRLMVTRRFLKGERIFELGDTGAELFVVQEGEIRIHRDNSGREITLATVGPSSVIGEMAFFDDLPRSAGGQASSDCTVRVLRKDRFDAIVHDHPEVLVEVIRNLSQRLRDANEQLQSASSPQGARTLQLEVIPAGSPTPPAS